MELDYTKPVGEADEKCYVCGAESNIAVVSPEDDATGHVDMRAYCWDCLEKELTKYEQTSPKTD